MNTANIRRSAVRRAVLTKSAGLASDFISTLPTAGASSLPVVGPIAGAVGSAGFLGGLTAKPKDDSNPDTDGLSVVPGIGQFRMGQRARRVMDASNAAGRSGTANVVAENLGKLTSPLVSTGVGGLLGAGLGAAFGGRAGARRGAGRGAVLGAAAGLTAPLIGGLVAAIRRKRSKQEQVDSDTTGRAVAKYLVPGLASYDSFKRMGASTHYDAAKKDGKGGKKAAEATQKRAQQAMPNALGAAGLAIGGAMGGSAVTGDDQSLLKRLGKGTAAAGLMYGGYKAMTDPKWQQAIRNGGAAAVNATRTGVEKAIAAIRGLFGKQAESGVLSANDAYVAGFCKAAEAAGVDPVALAKAADWVSDWVNKNLPDYTPQERLVQELQAKKDRGVDIEKYRTSNVGNWAGSVGAATAGTLGTTVLAGLHGDAIGRGDNFLGSANGWIKHLRKFAPTASARHPGVAKALGRLINSGVKGGAYALPILATLGIIGKFNNRRAVNSAIDQVKGTK